MYFLQVDIKHRCWLLLIVILAGNCCLGRDLTRRMDPGHAESLISLIILLCTISKFRFFQIDVGQLILDLGQFRLIPMVVCESVCRLAEN